MSSRILAIGAGVFTVAVLAAMLWPESVVTHPAGVLCPEAPAQTAIENPKPFLRDDYMITPLAEFRLDARVLSRENYWWDGGSELSPVDLALGWQNMSDQMVVDMLDISQGSRWYKWKPVDALPLPRREIETSSANMHMIPATPRIERVLDDVCKGNIVHIEGYLVKVTSDGNWRWQSSLSREDVGDGACEVVYVEEMRIIS